MSRHKSKNIKHPNDGVRLIPNLNFGQSLAVSIPPEEHLLILAGAGTGKTRTLTTRLIYFLQRGISPEKIIAITFTNKAAEEMRERIKNSSLLSKSSRLPFIGTFHSLGAKILRKEAHLLGRNKNFIIWDQDDSLKIIKKILKETNWEDITPLFCYSVITRIKNDSKFEKALKTKEINRKELDLSLEVFEKYEKILAKCNVFDLDDLVEKPVYLFQKYPDILSKYQKRFKYIFVDEYQDLNHRQYELLRLIGGKCALTVVGDDQQMIYGWRGSDIKIFLNFEKDWGETKIVALEQSYRSTANIINASSSLAAHNVLRKPKSLWTKNPEGEEIRVIQFASPEEEAWVIAKEIAQRHINQEADKGGHTAILYRTNAQSRALEQALLRCGVKFKIFGSISFYERKEIKDILAALRILINKNDYISQERLNKTFSKKKLENFRNQLKAKRTDMPHKLIEIFISSTEYFEYLKKNFINADERIENIKELISFAARFSGLSDFLEKTALLQHTDLISKSKQNNVSTFLMTLHLSKGLEFDNVYITGINEGIIPHNKSISSLEELEEERRLLYVGMTRAKKRLVLSFYDIPSRFLSEIPPELIRFSKSEELKTEEFGGKFWEDEYLSWD